MILHKYIKKLKTIRKTKGQKEYISIYTHYIDIIITNH